MDVVMNVEDGDGISDIVIDGDRFQMRESYVVMIIVKEFSKDFKRFQKISKDFKRIVLQGTINASTIKSVFTAKEYKFGKSIY